MRTAITNTWASVSFSDKMQIIGIASAVAALLLQLNVMLEDVEIRRVTSVSWWGAH